MLRRPIPVILCSPLTRGTLPPTRCVRLEPSSSCRALLTVYSMGLWQTANLGIASPFTGSGLYASPPPAYSNPAPSTRPAPQCASRSPSWTHPRRHPTRPSPFQPTAASHSRRPWWQTTLPPQPPRGFGCWCPLLPGTATRAPYRWERALSWYGQQQERRCVADEGGARGEPPKVPLHGSQSLSLAGRCC